MLKLDGSLWANAPALTAPCAFGHIVAECPSVVAILKTQSRSRTIFHTGQTSVAVIIYPKIGHFLIVLELESSFLTQIRV
jgi:hypothetical protein